MFNSLLTTEHELAYTMELELISSSSVVGGPADCDLMFHLEEENLPDFSQVHPWAGKMISALRDRSMIEWLFSQHEALKLINTMIAKIDSSIKRCNKQTVEKSRIRVGVVCETGAQLSPCFTERIYEHYTVASYSDALIVKRYHWDALRGSWGRDKDFVWQHKTVPVHPREDIREIFYDEMWKSFPTPVNAAIESAFSQDPHCNQFECAEYVFDFEGGTVYDRHRRKRFLLRCNMAVSDSKVISWFLGHHAYITTAKSYKAAGILPYSVHPTTGEALFLLGKITYGFADWCDFGGLRSRLESPRHTAARECWEETLGVIGSSSYLVTALKDYVLNNVFKVVNADTRYVGHFMRIPYKDYPSRFSVIVSRKKRQGGHVEVVKMSWFPISSMRKAVQLTLLGQLRVAVDPLDEDGSISKSCYLRTEFVDTLCIADKLGILNSIEHITMEIHKAERRPPAMPYVSIPKPRSKQLEALDLSSSAVTQHQSSPKQGISLTEIEPSQQAAEGKDDTATDLAATLRALKLGSRASPSTTADITQTTDEVPGGISPSAGAEPHAREKSDDIPKRRVKEKGRGKQSERARAQKGHGPPAILYYGMGAGKFTG